MLFCQISLKKFKKCLDIFLGRVVIIFFNTLNTALSVCWTWFNTFNTVFGYYYIIIIIKIYIKYLYIILKVY